MHSLLACTGSCAEGDMHSLSALPAQFLSRLYWCCTGCCAGGGWCALSGCRHQLCPCPAEDVWVVHIVLQATCSGCIVSLYAYGIACNCL